MPCCTLESSVGVPGAFFAGIGVGKSRRLMSRRQLEINRSRAICYNSFLLVGALDHCMPGQIGTRTVYFHMLSVLLACDFICGIVI